MLAKGEQALPLASGELETSGDGIGAGAILLLEHFGCGIGCHDAAPLVRGKEFRVLRDGDQRQVALACATSQVGQETTTFGMLDERPGLIDVEFARPGRVQHLRPHEIGDQERRRWGAVRLTYREYQRRRDDCAGPHRWAR